MTVAELRARLAKISDTCVVEVTFDVNDADTRWAISHLESRGADVVVVVVRDRRGSETSP